MKTKIKTKSRKIEPDNDVFENGNWTMVPNSFIKRMSHMPKRCVAVFLYLCASVDNKTRQNGHPTATRSQPTIAKRLGISVTTVQRAVSELIRMGYATVTKKRFNGYNDYEILNGLDDESFEKTLQEIKNNIATEIEKARRATSSDEASGTSSDEVPATSSDGQLSIPSYSRPCISQDIGNGLDTHTTNSTQEPIPDDNQKGKSPGDKKTAKPRKSAASSDDVALMVANWKKEDGVPPGYTGVMTSTWEGPPDHRYQVTKVTGIRPLTAKELEREAKWK